MRRLPTPARLVVSVLVYAVIPLGIASAFVHTDKVPPTTGTAAQQTASTTPQARQIAYWEKRIPAMRVQSITATRVVMVSRKGPAKMLIFSIN